MLLFLPVRVVIFGVVWLLTWGKLSFWLLPNLTEDVGFFDSFRPVYECTFSSKSESSDDDATSSGGDADKSAEAAEHAGGQEEKFEDHEEDIEVAGDDNGEGEGDEDNAAEEDIGDDDDDDDDESSSDVDADKDDAVGANENGYEMVSAEDVENGERVGDEAAAEDGDDKNAEESRPAVRRRKGKRRIT